METLQRWSGHAVQDPHVADPCSMVIGSDIVLLSVSISVLPLHGYISWVLKLLSFISLTPFNHMYLNLC